MKKALRLVAILTVAVLVCLGLSALLSAPARAVDNPCDPTYQMLKLCKAQHGRWDAACCRCKLH